MALQKNFFNREPDFIKISRIKVVVGILIGLFFSFVFYSFLYLIRETFRIMSATGSQDLLILTDKEVNFYNLFFAFIAVILAQSVTFTFWFDRPRSIFNKPNHRKTAIINDQRVLNCYFLSWFSKLAVLFGLFFGFVFRNGFSVFSFYPDYNYIFILIIVVLFLQTWTTIRLTFKRKSLKWMLSTVIILSIVAFGWSRINLIDYKAINQNYLQKNMHHKYQLEYPGTDNFQKFDRPSLIKNIYVVDAKYEKSNSAPIIIVDDKKITLEKLPNKIKDWQSNFYEHNHSHMVYRLHIHKFIKMDFVNQLKNKLKNSGASKIAYAIRPKNPEYDKQYYQNHSYSLALPNWSFNRLNPKAIHKRLSKVQNIIKIKQTLSDYYINDSIIEVNRLKETIEILIQKNSDYIIKFHINDNVNFIDYFRVLSHTKGAINELRDKYSEKQYAKKYNNLVDYEKINEVRNKFPFRIFELTSGLKKKIENE